MLIKRKWKCTKLYERREGSRVDVLRSSRIWVKTYMYNYTNEPFDRFPYENMYTGSDSEQFMWVLFSYHLMVEM